MKISNRLFPLGFKGKLILVVTIVSTISLISSNWFSFDLASDNAKQAIFKDIDHSLSAEANKIEGSVQRTIDTVNAVATEMTTGKFTTANQVLMHYAATLGGIDKIVVGFDDGRTYTSRPSASFPDGVGILERYDPRTRPWYKQAKQTMGLSFSDLFFTKSDQTPMIGVMHASSDRVIMADIRFNDLETQLAQLENIYQSKGIIVDENGMVVASTIEGISAQDQLQDLSKDTNLVGATQSPETFINGFYNGEEVLLMAKVVHIGEYKQWHMISVMDPVIALGALGEVMSNARILVISSILCSLAILIFVLNRLYRPIVSLRKIVNDLSRGDGDLTQRLDERGNDDLSNIAQNINLFISGLQEMIQEVKLKNVDLNSKVLSIESGCKNTDDILKVHTDETSQVVVAIDSLNEASDVVERNSQAAAEAAHDAAAYSDDTKQINELTETYISDLETQVDSTSNDIMSMANETQSIQSIVSVIGGIAEQTNLLALNASIEAARAGEHGRGFAVVADEVRALANRTQESTSEIEEALKSLQGKSDGLVTSIEQTKSNCEKTRTQVIQAVEMLDKLSGKMETVSRFNADISTSSVEQNSVIQNITQNIHEIENMVQKLNGLSRSQVEESQDIESINSNINSLMNRFVV